MQRLCFQLYRVYYYQLKIFIHIFKLIIKMQTSLRFQYEVAEDRPLHFVLPGNIKSKYLQFPPEMVEVLKLTEKCPFTQIRQLIISFKRPDPFTTDLMPCDILTQKYDSNSSFRDIDQQLNKCLAQIQLSKIRFEKLDQCVNRYNQLYDELKHGNIEISNIRSSGSGINKYSQEQEVSMKKNSILLQQETKYFQFDTYSQELERALIISSVSQSHKIDPKKNSNKLSGINNFRMLTDFSVSLKAELDSSYESIVLRLFDWRELVKNRRVNNESISLTNNDINEWRKKFEEIDSVVVKMSTFTQWLERDREELRRTYESNARSYKQFLIEHIKIKQKYEISSKNSYYHQIIKQQKKLLEEHLRKNYGLVVPYSFSPEFSKMVSPLQNDKNRQLKRLLGDQLTPLEQSVAYLNVQYQKLYKEVCDSKYGSGVKKKIEDNIKKFTNFSHIQGQNNNFAIHLIQSCQKLLRLIK